MPHVSDSFCLMSMSYLGQSCWSWTCVPKRGLQKPTLSGFPSCPHQPKDVRRSEESQQCAIVRLVMILLTF